MGREGVYSLFDLEWRKDVTGRMIRDTKRIDLEGLEIDVTEIPGHSSCSAAAYIPKLKLSCLRTEEEFHSRIPLWRQEIQIIHNSRTVLRGWIDWRSNVDVRITMDISPGRKPRHSFLKQSKWQNGFESRWRRPTNGLETLKWPRKNALPCFTKNIPTICSLQEFRSASIARS